MDSPAPPPLAVHLQPSTVANAAAALNLPSPAELEELMRRCAAESSAAAGTRGEACQVPPQDGAQQPGDANSHSVDTGVRGFTPEQFYMNAAHVNSLLPAGAASLAMLGASAGHGELPNVLAVSSSGSPDDAKLPPFDLAPPPLDWQFRTDLANWQYSTKFAKDLYPQSLVTPMPLGNGGLSPLFAAGLFPPPPPAFHSHSLGVFRGK
eukprot:TRINITY_DN30227_c0_g1_i2.p1 TRINITY_DN30227_c0_g1~~TRINITY_DN30227_c0_g1_i2.p1  ORF type:complete len:208 (+),score=23.62 TRINITY_DN30227_c0_g1_i2:49-672(+)